MDITKLTKVEARRLILAWHGLLGDFEFAGKEGILNFIDRVHCIQFDPINIVGRNPDLVLQSRMEKYDPSWLESTLYENRSLIDYWDKNMSIFRTGDWPYFQRLREYNRKIIEKSNRVSTEVIDQVRMALRENGPMCSLDLKMKEKVNWYWAPTSAARAALDAMFYWGELVIHHRVNTRKYYDFADRWLKGSLLELADPNKTLEEYIDWRVLRRIDGVGYLPGRAGDGWWGVQLFKTPERRKSISGLLEEGQLQKLQIEGIGEELYIRNRALFTFRKYMNVQQDKRASILAALDNFLWDRRMIKELFGFEYTWEVYKPEAERKYGYYVLPVLYDHYFVGRFEPGFDKETKTLQIKNWWWEDGIQPNEEMEAALRNCFTRFSNYLGAEAIACSPQVAAEMDLRWLSGLKLS